MRRLRISIVLAGLLLPTGCAQMFWPEQVESQKRREFERQRAIREGRLIEIRVKHNPFAKYTYQSHHSH